MDKNDDGFVTLTELNEFNQAIFKDKKLTQGEVWTQHRMLKNMLGYDDQFDFDEYWYYINTLTTPSPPTTIIFDKYFSEKPSQFWDTNGDGGWTPEEMYRFKMK